MTSFLFFGLAPASLVLGVGLAGFLRITRSIGHAGLRRANVAAGVLAAALLLPPLAGRSLAVADEGTWMCLLCGRLEEQQRYGGLVVWSGSAYESEAGAAVAERYSTWFERAVAIEHEHDWMSVGCHGSGLGVACSMPPDRSLFHVSLPLVPDEELALAFVRRLQAADEARRRVLLRDMDKWKEEKDPFLALAEGEPLSRAAFRHAYGTWLESHPLWR